MRFLPWVLALAVVGTPAVGAPDAESEYSVARRLVAEGSPQAAAALDRVVQLDPDGPLADDALLERAKLVGLPAWPEDLGRLTPSAIGAASPYLSRIVRDLGGGDRAAEAAYRLALLRLEPVPGHDAESARLQFLTLAGGAGPESRAARYALAWLAEQRGELDRAEATYQRLRIDAPWSEVAARATFAVGRLRLRQARPAAAAARIQQALTGAKLEPALALRAAALRDLAVDALLRRVTTTESLRVKAGSRPSAIAATSTRGALIAERRTGTVIEYDATGVEVERWAVEQPLGTTLSANGSRYAVTAAAVLRLEAGGRTTVAAGAAELGSFSAAAVDDLGRVWALDRKGERVGVFETGAARARVLWTGDGVRLSGLVRDGNRLLALDLRARGVIAIEPDGSTRNVVTGLDRPTALAVDPAGRIAVLDAKGTAVRFYDAGGTPLGSLAPSVAGMQRASGLALGRDGSLHLVEEGSGLWWGAR